jgi:arylsulfatase A-like enzyme
MLASGSNILFIVIDDCGYAGLGCTGQTDYRTPALDRLAAEGVRFTQAYANSALCTNTRVALITGRYQYRLPIGLVEPLRWSDRQASEMGVPLWFSYLAGIAARLWLPHRAYREMASRIFAALRSVEERL